MTETKKNIIAEFFKKNSLLISALALSIVLMIIFKKNNVEYLLNEKSNFLSNFELINFRPLFDDRTLTNEEVFHFLMHNQIPIDEKKERVLKIQERSPNVYSYNIRTADYKKEVGSYKNFLKYLKVNEPEKEKIDKMLHECGIELNENILKGNAEELAISPKLVSIRQKTLIKLFSYLSEIRPSLINKVFPPDYLQKRNIEAAAALQNSPEKFLILTPDTVVVAEIKDSKNIPSSKKNKSQISVAVNSNGDATVKLEVCDMSQNEPDDLGIEWYKILPTHSKIVFKDFGEISDGDSLNAYLNMVTDMIKRFEINIEFDSTNHSVTLRGKNSGNVFSFDSENGLRELEKMFGPDFNFTDFTNVAELENIGIMIDSLSRAYSEKDSAEWSKKMRKAIKELENIHSEKAKEKK